MNRIVLYMARSRPTWLLWCLAGSPIVLFAFLVDLVGELARAVWSSRFTWQEWAQGWSEKNRLRLRSLALKPVPGGEKLR